MYKLIALDMDGTLLNSEKKIPEKTKEALMEIRKNGVRVVLASGRPLDGLTKFLDELELETDDDFTLSFNGGVVINNKTKEVISSAALKGSDLKEIYKVSQELGINIHAFSVNEGLITPKMSMGTQCECDINGITATIKDFNTIDDNEDIIKVMMIDPQEKLDKAIEKLPKYLYEKYNVFKSAPIFLEFTNPAVDKGKGLDKLAQYLGLKAEEIIACGDQGNDLSMVKYAGLGVAMGNAIDEVKEAADYITITNDEEGVLKVIEEFILDKAYVK